MNSEAKRKKWLKIQKALGITDATSRLETIIAFSSEIRIKREGEYV